MFAHMNNNYYIIKNNKLDIYVYIANETLNRFSLSLTVMNFTGVCTKNLPNVQSSQAK